MNFQKYLESTIQAANEEKDILDELSSKATLSPIEIRAARNSLQIIIENAIGKAKRILKHYNSPIVPQRARDSIDILYEVGAIDDDTHQSLTAAIGFRNVLIHDYMKFNNDVLFEVLKNKDYLIIYKFLIEKPDYSLVIISRIENFSF
jgi:uncharacterized protein YutE (UPF0331/DUF86 family)